MSNQFLKNISQPKNVKPVTELEKLWQKVEKHTKRNANFDKKKQALFEKFKEIVLPHEEIQANLMAKQVAHLSQFIPRKSLTIAERNELIDWINDDLDYLHGHPFKGELDFKAVEKIFEKYLAQHNDVAALKFTSSQLDELRQVLTADYPGLVLSDEQLREFTKNPDLLNRYLEEQGLLEHTQEQGHTHSEHSNAGDDEFWEDFFQNKHDDFKQIKHQQKSSQLEKLFKGSQLNKMYKRLASKLHPDKESDRVKKAQKHEQMQALAEARKNKDGFTILKLYLENFEDVELDSETEQDLVPLLKQQVERLNEQYREQKENNELATLVWRQFNARTQREVEQGLEQHAANLHFEADEISARITNCTTVKTLKQELRERLNVKHGMMSQNFIQLLNSTFDN